MCHPDAVPAGCQCLVRTTLIVAESKPRRLLRSSPDRRRRPATVVFRACTRRSPAPSDRRRCRGAHTRTHCHLQRNSHKQGGNRPWIHALIREASAPTRQPHEVQRAASGRPTVPIAPQRDPRYPPSADIALAHARNSRYLPPK
jgi:hypothetical protein